MTRRISRGATRKNHTPIHQSTCRRPFHRQFGLLRIRPRYLTFYPSIFFTYRFRTKCESSGFMNHAARASDFLDRVGTIDFWAAEHHVKDSFASRYRLCRTADAPKTRLVTYQDTVLYPEETHDKMDQCCRSYCRNPTSERKWQYNAATNKPRMAKRTNHGESDPRPIPGSELRISCAVAHWSKVRAREVLHRVKVLLFDADPGVADREWSLLEVRPPDVWAGVVITRALDRLDARSLFQS